MFVTATLTLTHGAAGGLGILAALVRFVRYACSLVAVGGFVFLVAVRPADVPLVPAGRRTVVGAAGVGALATLLAVPLQAASLVDRAGGAVDGATLAAVLEAGFGRSVLLGLGGLLLLGLAIPRLPAAPAAGFGAAGALLTLGAFLLTGHTAVSEPQVVTLAANLAHTAAAGVWLGGLVLLPLALRDRRAADDLDAGARLVGRFSTVATLALGAVAAGGLALAWVEVRDLAALATPYGLVLSVKVAVVAGVAALGAYNNRRLVPAVRTGATGGWDRLSRTVRLEAAGLVGVVAITAVLVTIVPARVEAGIGTQVIRAAPLGAERVATVIVEPARPGANEVHLFVDGGALDEQLDTLTLAFLPPDEDTVTATISPTRVGPGHWLHLGPELTRSGEWRLELVAEVAGEREAVMVAVPVTGVDEWDDL
jgi:copper transport protein